MTTPPEPLPLGAEAPAFELPATDGRRVALRDLDAPVFVYVQACNHCPYVLANLGRLKRLARDFEARGVAFVFVNSNDAEVYPSDDFGTMQRFAEENALPFPYLHDADQSVARAYRTQRTPEILVFDASRRLRYHGRIDDSPKTPDHVTKEDLREALDALVAGRDVREPETYAMGCSVKWKPGIVPEVA